MSQALQQLGLQVHQAQLSQAIKTTKKVQDRGIMACMQTNIKEDRFKAYLYHPLPQNPEQEIST